MLTFVSENKTNQNGTPTDKIGSKFMFIADLLFIVSFAACLFTVIYLTVKK